MFKKLVNFNFYEHLDLVTIILTDLVGVEELRKRVNSIIDAKNKAYEKDYKSLGYKDAQEYKDNSDSYEIFLMIRSLITPNHDKIAIENLQKFYAEKIKFEDYGINQKMNSKEVELLKSLIKPDEKVLEQGCGTGRLLLELKQAGYDITGYDFTRRHVDLIKAKDGEAKVFQGDWHNNALKDQSFNRFILWAEISCMIIPSLTKRNYSAKPRGF